MTEYALKLLERVEKREAEKKEHLDAAIVRMTNRARRCKALENERKYGGGESCEDDIDEVFARMAMAGHSSKVYEQIRAGFDNGGCKTRRGTYKRFKMSQGKQAIPRAITRRKV